MRPGKKLKVSAPGGVKRIVEERVSLRRRQTHLNRLRYCLQ